MKTRVRKRFVHTAILGILGLLVLICCNDDASKPQVSESIPEIDKNREAKLLTAFFGLDNALPKRAKRLYRNAPGQDGMPLVFSHELEPNTLQASDFEVTTQNGTIFQVEGATLLPANEEFELRTVLLIGEYGNYPDNPPTSVKIVGDLLSRTKHNFKGESIAVIPLEDGPILSYAEYFTYDENYPYVEKGRGCDCLKKKTKMVVRTVWAGGVRAINGDELGTSELNDFEVTLLQGKDTLLVRPYPFADLDDNDNNIDLCLKETGIPILVKVNENRVIDPRGDANPKTH
ncbi:MAG: hypothetical protein AAF765_14435, partial [Bacteroidota bacterium]